MNLIMRLPAVTMITYLVISLLYSVLYMVMDILVCADDICKKLVVLSLPAYSNVIFISQSTFVHYIFSWWYCVCMVRCNGNKLTTWVIMSEVKKRRCWNHVLLENSGALHAIICIFDWSDQFGFFRNISAVGAFFTFV